MKKFLYLSLVVLLASCTFEKPSRIGWFYDRYIDTIQVSDSVWAVNAVYKTQNGIGATKIATIIKEDGK